MEKLEFVDISPSLAEKYLVSCKKNRTITRRRVEMYARMMEEGKWGPFSPVIIDEEGHLIDGNHRMSAVVKCGQTVRMLVISNVDKKFLPYIDTGRPRSAADCLTFMDELGDYTSMNSCCAIAKFRIALMNRDMAHMSTNEEICDFIFEHGDAIKKAVSCSYRIKKAGFKVNTGLSAALMKIYEKGNCRFEGFIDRICDGQMLNDGSPVLAFRNYLLRTKTVRGRGAISNLISDFLVVAKTWNAYVSGEEIYKFMVGGATFAKFSNAYDCEFM